MNKRLPDHVRLLLQYVLTAVSQLKDYFFRQELTRVVQRLRKDLNQIYSGIAEKFSLLDEKLNGLERRVEGLEPSSGSDTRMESELRGLASKTRDLSTECSNCRESSVELERELKEMNVQFVVEWTKVTSVLL